jgi:TldD protein
MSEERLGRASYEVLARDKPWETPFEDKVKVVLEVSREVASSDVKVGSKAFTYNDTLEYKYIVTSDGGEVESLTPRVTVFYNIAASNGGRSANKWGEVGGAGGLEVLREMGLRERVLGDLESLKIALTKAGPPPRGVMDVVISPEIVGLALHESIGHPSEADRVLGREAAQAGRSYREGRSGRIGSEAVTVIDDPTVPGSSGFYLYDDEAVPARPRKLIDRGVLAELLHNRETAAEMGVNSNAAARAADYRSEPIVRMATTYLQPGDYTFEELIEDVREGVYLKTYMEWNIDEWRLTARYVGLEAYMIRGGRLAEPVRDVVLQIPTWDFYSKIDAVGRDLQFYPGICGKGEPMQPLPVWMGGPHVRLRGVRVG